MGDARYATAILAGTTMAKNSHHAPERKEALNTVSFQTHRDNRLHHYHDRLGYNPTLQPVFIRHWTFEFLVL